MKFGLMFSDISHALFRKPATENYPAVRQLNPPRLRSFLKWNQQSCTGCGLCAMDCPANAIHVTISDRKEKRTSACFAANALKVAARVPSAWSTTCGNWLHWIRHRSL
jgi:formate hydrogenlyase subunit 6/NADH:ubiquinone oxidoreductase subunit I